MKVWRTFKQIERYQQIASILLRNGFDNLVVALEVEKHIHIPFTKPNKEILHLSRSERIKKTVEELGPTFIKFAQILSTRPDLIPLELADAFSKLQDEVSPIPFSEIEQVFLEEFGKKSSVLFDGELELVASASLGQVYKATLLSGEEVAVKVQKPNITQKIAADIAIMRQIASFLKERLKEYGIDDAGMIIDEFEKTIKKELDFNIEALNLKRFAKNFTENANIKVPRLYEDLTTQRILTMEYIEGVKVSDKKALEDAGIDPSQVAKNGFDLLCEQIFVHRYFHADPHPGNIFALEDGRLSFIDFGMMGRIGERDQRYFVDMIYYIVKNEEEKAAYNLLKLAKVKDENMNIDAFCKDMGDIISTYFYGSLKDISIQNLLNDMIALMSRYQVYFREDNYLLTKALITIEGVGKQLDPSFNAAEEIRPFVLRFYKNSRSLGAFIGKVGEIPKDFSDFVSDFPDDIKFLVQKLKNGNFKMEFEHVGLEALEHSIEKSFNRLSIAIIIAAVLIGSSLLSFAKMPPLFFGIPIFGLIGFMIALLMGVVLIVSIYKRGKL
jgi:ubiquinone biosynthesis protein